MSLPDVSRKRTRVEGDGRTSKRRKETNEQPDWDDKDGHYIIKLGQALDDERYKMLDILGEGTFGRVVECFDRQVRKTVAVKIIKAIPKYRNAAKIELRVLKKLKEQDPEDTKCCIQLLHWFDFRNHICMVFEKLSMSLFDFAKENDFRAFPIRDVQHYALQIATAVDFMHKCGLTHTDLKPENILISHQATIRSTLQEAMFPLSTAIKVIDFGSATFRSEHHTTVVSTRHYRAPEVILELGWETMCDLWSLGCILMELFTGRALFQTHDNLEHLAIMERVIGPIPLQFASESPHFSKFFSTSKRQLRWPSGAKDRHSVAFVEEATFPLASEFKTVDALEAPFHDLIRSLLRFDSPSHKSIKVFGPAGELSVVGYNPHDRTTASEVLSHPFFASYDEAAHRKYLFDRWNSVRSQQGLSLQSANELQALLDSNTAREQIAN